MLLGAWALVAVGAGALTSLGFPPVDVPALGVAGLTLGLVALARTASRGAGAATAFAFAVGLFGSVLSWSARFGAPAYLALVAAQALWFVPVGLVAGGLGRQAGRAGLRA